jgi:hypothetical protein
MNESNSFKDAVKRVLTTEKKKPAPIPKPKKKKTSSYVSEALNSNSMPDTITPSSYAGGVKGMPPFAKYTTNTEAGSVDMRDIGKAEDDKAKSVQRKPYPLEKVLNFIATSGESLQNAQSMIEISLRKNDVSLTPEQKKRLQDTQQTIKSSLGNISKAAKTINSINLS